MRFTETKLPFLISGIVAFYSCSTNQEAKTTSPIISEQNIIATPTVRDETTINYTEHKNLFTILSLLPDSALSSWKWTRSERSAFVKALEKNNATETIKKPFSKITLIGPNALQLSITDGSWVLAIYRLKQNNYLVITNDMVGDGDDLNAFEFKEEKLSAIPFATLFDQKYLSNLLQASTNANCNSLLKDNTIGFDYDFSDAKRIRINNAHQLKEQKDKHCFKGNTLTYKFNPKNKNFDLAGISWVNEE